MTLILSAQAERDMEDHVDWLAERSLRAARKAHARILRVFDLLERNPRLGLETERGWREKGVAFGRDGFVICYVLRGEDAFVLRVRHSREPR